MTTKCQQHDATKEDILVFLCLKGGVGGNTGVLEEKASLTYLQSYGLNLNNLDFQEKVLNFVLNILFLFHLFLTYQCRICSLTGGLTQL